MDRIKIDRSAATRSSAEIPDFGAKNAALPLMIASLLTEDELTADQRAAPRRRRTARSASSAITASTSWSPASAPARTCFVGQTLTLARGAPSSTPPRPTTSSPPCGRASGSSGRSSHRMGQAQGVAARRLRHRHAARRFLSDGAREASARPSNRRRLRRRSARQGGLKGRAHRLSEGVRRRHARRDDGRGPRRGHHRHRQRRARAWRSSISPNASSRWAPGSRVSAPRRSR
jgi:hypothetical protein